jgi:hypothetical protein
MTESLSVSLHSWHVSTVCAGHTFFDAWLMAAGCIGQVMMTTPHAWNKMGLAPGAILIVWGTAIGFWTIWQ